MGETELGKYIKEKDEKNYKRHQLEPLGKSTYAANSGADSKLPAYTSHPDFKFGQKTERSEAGTKELIEIDPENQTDLASIYGAEREKHIPSRLNPNRVTAGNLVNPTRWSEMGVHREQLTEHRDFEAVLALYKKAGFPVATETAAKIKSALTEKSVYGGVC